MMEYVVVFITAGSTEEAGRIASLLVHKKLVACSNVIHDVNSTFWWKGKVDRAKELLIVAKTEKSRLDQVIKLVKQIHSYELPEIIALPIVGGDAGYLDWIGESLK